MTIRLPYIEGGTELVLGVAAMLGSIVPCIPVTIIQYAHLTALFTCTLNKQSWMTDNIGCMFPLSILKGFRGSSDERTV